MHKLYFVTHNYKNSELFATTYSDVGLTPIISKTMDCADVKLVGTIRTIFFYFIKQLI